MSAQKKYWKEPTQRHLEKKEGEPDRLNDEEPLEARPTSGVDEGGSSPTAPYGGSTVDPSSLGAETTLGPQRGALAEASVKGDNTLDDLTIRDASDASLGLTDVDDFPPEDWAANTGPAVTAEEGSEGATRRLNSERSELDPEP